MGTGKQEIRLSAAATRIHTVYNSHNSSRELVFVFA